MENLSETLLESIEANDIEVVRRALAGAIDWDFCDEGEGPLVQVALETASAAPCDPPIVIAILSRWALDQLAAIDQKEKFLWLEKSLNVESLTENWDWEKDFSGEELLHLESDYASVFIYAVPLETATLFVEHPFCDELFGAKPRVRAISRAKTGILTRRKVVREIVGQGAIHRLVGICEDAGFEDGNEICIDGPLSTTMKQVYGSRILHKSSSDDNYE